MSVMKNAWPCSRGHRGTKLRQARQPEFCLSPANVVSTSNAESGQLTQAFHHGLRDILMYRPSICKMGLKNSCMHILAMWQFFILNHRSPKSLTLRTPGCCPTAAAPFTLLPPLFYTQISQPTRPFAWDLPGFSNSSPSFWETPQSQANLDSWSHSRQFFMSQAPELQDTPLSLTSASSH